MTTETRFPKGFHWGVATSAYQIEGAVREDGRGESIWDRFCATPGAVRGGDNADVACDHYHRWESDLDLIASLGMNAYRFSIAWARIQPTGAGAPNQAGLDFYRRLIEGMLARGLRPSATLYHWDLPAALEDAGGWRSRDTALRFAEFAAIVGAELGELVPAWTTHNEPWVAAYQGYGWGTHAPGVRDWPGAVRASHHLLLSHGLAVRALRESVRGDAEIGIVLNLVPAHPATDSEADRAAAWRMDGFQNRWFLDPVLRGAYPSDMLAEYDRHGWPIDIQDGDLATIAAPIDALGVNYYSCSRVAHDDDSAFLRLRAVPPRPPLTSMDWELDANGLRDLLVRLGRDYPPVRLAITENGAAYPDPPPGDGPIDDRERTDYFRTHVEAVLQAIRRGADVRGYYAWSLLDNFEWAEGNDMRFGIVSVDYATQERVPKASALWLAGVARANALPEEDAVPAR